MQPSRRSGRSLRLLLVRRAGILAPGVDVAVDEFDHRDRRRVAVAEPGLEHARVAAVALLVARTDDVEELFHHGDVADLGDGLAPRLPSVTSFSTIGRRSLALGSVVTICSCLMSAAAMLPNMARRCSAARLSLR